MNYIDELQRAHPLCSEDSKSHMLARKRSMDI